MNYTSYDWHLSTYPIANLYPSMYNPGTKYHFSIIMVTCDGRKTKPSNTVSVMCPRAPEALQLGLDDLTRHEAKITWTGIKGKHVPAYL